jgi:hypothetical protein
MDMWEWEEDPPKLSSDSERPMLRVRRILEFSFPLLTTDTTTVGISLVFD